MIAPSRLRELRGDTPQRALAARADVDPATVSTIERHQMVPGPRVREKLARCLGVTEADIWPSLDAKEGGGRDEG